MTIHPIIAKKIWQIYEQENKQGITKVIRIQPVGITDINKILNENYLYIEFRLFSFWPSKSCSTSLKYWDANWWNRRELIFKWRTSGLAWKASLFQLYNLCSPPALLHGPFKSSLKWCYVIPRAEGKWARACCGTIQMQPWC